MLVGALVIGVSLVLGFFAFLILGAIVAVLAAVIGIRLWWLNRKLLREAAGRRADGSQSPDHIIEGEFRVVDDSGRPERQDDT